MSKFDHQDNQPISNDEFNKKVNATINLYKFSVSLNESTKPNSEESSLNKQKRTDVESFTSIDSPVYMMTHKKRSKCVVFVHEKLEQKLCDPIKWNRDEAMISKTFSALWFRNCDYKDLNSVEITDITEELKYEDHSDSDCICIFILTYGKKNGWIYSFDGFTADTWPFYQPHNHCENKITGSNI
ncbi:caspase-like [Apis florea]|uniref:caspase-like n=1 Tax=Apis florea TaxID=7463 RepID=UPI000629B12C|nr:caspase-like [Apis florea]